ncbi:hypothetical protein BY996DRAFT_6529376 [Phakopsora pachyrhizi]|uniref:Uncharacterized protein n=1 Tax=Phakopsora pachyrhizi TaxID=170000 RepID=A0AAV0B2K7_PHAPC|nr:hypothetical protein BY996DRAFT_6529376 [Phakopsora pachyrhizi]CAH7678514.1 hypothetical protein PPACK8108_LOCUS13042 [Phakopsora pachyrhizi]
MIQSGKKEEDGMARYGLNPNQALFLATFPPRSLFPEQFISQSKLQGVQEHIKKSLERVTLHKQQPTEDARENG